MNLFNQRQPKRFSYTPTQLKKKDEKKPSGFEPNWRKNSQRHKKSSTLLILLVILGMVIVVWYVLTNYEI